MTEESHPELFAQARLNQLVGKLVTGTAILNPENYDKGYWDKSNGFPKDQDLKFDLDYRNGWKKGKSDTKEIAFINNR